MFTIKIVGIKAKCGKTDNTHLLIFIPEPGF